MCTNLNQQPRFSRKSEIKLEPLEDCATDIITPRNSMDDLLRGHHSAPDGLFDLLSARFGACGTDTDRITVDAGLE